MTGRRLVCRDCGQPLEIVCPTHGRTVSVVAPEPETPTTRNYPPMRRVPGEARSLVLEHLSLDPEHPSTARSLRNATGIKLQHVNVLLSKLAGESLVTRVGRGRYVRAEGRS